MGIIQPKMLFSRIRISQASGPSGLDPCLDSHSWLRVVSLPQAFCNSHQSCGSQSGTQLRWKFNQRHFEDFNLWAAFVEWMILSGLCWHVSDPNGFPNLQESSGQESLHTEKKTQGISKVRLPHDQFAVTSKRMIIVYVFYYQIPHLPWLLAAGPFWLACADELRWSGGELDPLGLSLPERQRLSALVLFLSGQLRLRCSARRIEGAPYSFHSPTRWPPGWRPRSKYSAWSELDDAPGYSKKNFFDQKPLAVEMGMKCIKNQYEMHWNKLALTAEDVIFDMPQEVVGRYQASVEDTVRRSHKRTQRSTHVARICNLRMFSHCAGVAPADCPEYSKRPEHNPLVRSLDCCSKFRSLMTVASGVFDRNIAHVFNEYAVFDTCCDVSWHIQQEGIKGNTSWRVGDTSSVERPLTPERERERWDWTSP